MDSPRELLRGFVPLLGPEQPSLTLMFPSCPLSIALTKLDILDVFSEIKVGMSYKVDDQMIPHFPGEREPAVSSERGFCFRFGAVLLTM